MDKRGFDMNREFDRIVDRNIDKWSRLNNWLATERLGNYMIKNKEYLD